MRPPTANRPSLLLPLVLLSIACQSSPAPLLPSLPPTPNRSFSAETAWQHLQAISEIGPRASGGSGAAEARRYIAAQLSELGLVVDVQTFMFDIAENEPPLALTNLSVTIPGASQDLIVLAASYDTLEFEPPPLLGVNDGASGPALLLELARVLNVAPLAYSTRLLFLEGEQRIRVGDTEIVHFGSRATARHFESQGMMPRIRLFVTFNRVAGADLRILRDRRSHRFTREAFWDAAAQLGYTDAFPRSARFESPDAGHVSFLEAGLRPAAAIVGAGPTAESSAETDDAVDADTLEHCSAASLETVGIVTLQTLETQSQRLARIDRVSGVPVPAEVPATAGEASPPGPEALETTSSEAPREAADAPEPQAAAPEPQAAEVEPQAEVPEPLAVEVDPQVWEIAPLSIVGSEPDGNAATAREAAPATPFEEAPDEAAPLCANDGLSRCPRAPRSAAPQQPAPSGPDEAAQATGIEPEAATP